MLRYFSVLLLSCLLGLSGKLHAQSTGTQILTKAYFDYFYTDYDSCYQLINQAIRLYEKTDSVTEVVNARILLLDLLHYNLKWQPYPQVLESTKRYWTRHQHEVSPLDQLINQAEITYREGVYFANLGEYVPAIEAFQTVSHLLKDSVSLNTYILGLARSADYYLVTIYQRLGQFNQALIHQKSVLDLDSIAKSSGFYAMSVMARKKYADLLIDLGETDYATQQYQLALSQGHQILRDSVNSPDYSLYRNHVITVCLSLIELQIADAAFESAKRSLSMIDSIPTRGSLEPYIEDRFGDYHLATGDFEQAKGYYMEALGLRLKTEGKKSVATAISYQKLAQHAQASHQWDSALYFIQQEQIALVRPFETLAIDQQPPLTQILSKPALLRSLTSKASVLRQQTADLDLAWTTIQLATDLIDSIRQDYTADYDKQYLIQQGYQTYEEALHIAYALHAQTGDETILHTAFQMVEQSKGLLLREALLQAQASRFAGVPDALVARERQIRAELKYTEDQWLNALLKGEPAEDWQTQLASLQAQHQALLDTLSQQAPQYYRSAYALSTVSPQQVSRQVLTSDQVLIEYFHSDTSLFAFVLADGHTRLVHLPEAAQLAERVSALREGLYGYQLLPPTQQNDGTAQAYAERYTTHAFDLYQQLFDPLKPYLAEAKRIVLIPDGVLGYVPFETLLTAAPTAETTQRWGTHPYLIESYTMSYSYSATLLAEMQDRAATPATDEVLGFACTFREGPHHNGNGLRGSLKPIPGAAKTVQSIGQIFSLKPFIDPDATKERFMSEAPHYGIIHLATHGILDDEDVHQSFLAFYGANDSNDVGKLFLRDIYQLDLRANLVVLGACETGLGELKRGEGVVSLARGFSYAGAQSIVPTLWSVSDDATTLLMERFYANLSEGMPKDEALRQARLHYLHEMVLDQSFMHPFYWGATIVVGDTAPVKSSGINWLLLLIGAFIVAGLGIGVMRSRMNRAA